MNPINIAKGLLGKWDQVKDIDHELADSIKGELSAMKADVLKAVGELRGLVDPPTIELEDGSHVPTAVAEEIRSVGRRIEEVTGSGAKRTAAAAKAPNKAD